MEPVLVGLLAVSSLLVLFLVGREIMCWYWKINRIIFLLESINAKLGPGWNEALPERKQHSGNLTKVAKGERRDEPRTE